MDKDNPLFDPTAIDIVTAVNHLLSVIDDLHQKPPTGYIPPFVSQHYYKELQAFAASVDPQYHRDTSNLLNCLSRLLLVPLLTKHVVQAFRPIVIDLVARWLVSGSTSEMDSEGSSSIFEKVEGVARAFSIMLPIVPQIKSLAVSFFAQSPSLFERLNTMDEYELAPRDQNPETTISLHTLLLTTYRLLSFSTSTFVRLWNWSPLFRLLSHPDEGVRYYTVMCLSMVFGMSDSQRWTALSSAVDSWKEGGHVLGYVEGSERPILVDVDGVKVDLRMLTLWEQQILAEAQLSFIRNNYFNAAATPILTDHDLSPLTTNLCGILLPKPHREFSDDVSRPPRKGKEALVLTPTTARNLHAIGLALSIGAPVLLEGMTGAGKTALVEEVARKTGRQDDLVKIHLGDQTDSKVLLGTYVSTSTPGSFRWQPGVLTTAVREGRWVLIEDIDLAPTEVVSVLLPLLETRNLFIPSRGEKIKAKEDFQLFATKSLLPTRGGRSVRSRGASAAETSMGSGLWTKVHVNTLSHEELTHVIQKRFPHLRALASNIMQVFQIIVSIYQDPNLSSFSASSMGRYISTRDLMKWCHRINILVGSKQTGDAQALFTELGIDQTVREDMFSEAVDCFCGMIVDYESWITVLERVGHALQISTDRVRLYVESYTPNLKIADKGISIGRVNLSPIVVPGKDQTIIKRERKRPFATTTHALRLLEQIAVCVYLCEPVLLVGETGTGKTTVVQYLADIMRQKLVVVNLSQQSDSSDLLGGFKPVDGKILAIPLKEEFDKLFERTFSVKKNAKFLETMRKMYVHKKWGNFLTLLKQAVKMAETRFESEQDDGKSNNDAEEGDTADKDAKTGRKPASPQLRNAWKKFMGQVNEFEVQQDQMQNKFVFSFLEGALVKAVRNGDWILLDEINLASTETLECLSGLLQDAEGSLLLTEKGDAMPIQRHLNFRVFACMNPATDVGKRDLPPGLRNRFTEFYVHPPDKRREDLLQIVQQYISNVAHGDERAKFDVADFYLSAKELAAQHKLVDGANQRPHFSMRTLTRALTYVGQIAPTYGLRRSLYEGFCMTFLTQLNKESEAIMHAQVYQHLLKGIKNPRQMVSQIPKQPAGGEFIPFGYFWLETGQEPVQEAPLYILTPSVEANLYNLARVVMSGKFPVLIQGPTSSGKTSMIEYLAKRTGHRFVRINNHEHTDLQEYLGTYVSNPDGQLVFQEGVLVEALRKGYWIVLDELNLAPSDVLEALNRLLDDNRELLIPETQEVVKPHPHFMLFATQNPAGLYGGRKALSRAFRNRFLELHFDDIPEDELETILSKRSQIAPSYCKKLVQVYKSLMERRQGTRIFEQKHGFITLRDLFRWAGRDAGSYQELAEQGYMLLAERCRKPDEKLVVKEVLETIMKVKLNEDDMYDCTKVEEFALYKKLVEETQSMSGTNKLVWTKAMRRLFTLVARCIRSNEPVLLVGETGCGKTTVCQMLAMARSKELHIVNCHQNTETADLLGGQRPVRNKATANSELHRDLINFLAECVVPKVDAMLDELDLEQLIAEFERILKDESRTLLTDNWMGTGDMSPDKLLADLRQRCKQARTLFEWHDGPLIQAMKHGDLILLDEISLADDSVLERLNSVLEPHRLLVLAEKGGKTVEELIAQDGFQFLATMNPGGDYGKKELSPALRNRFTEIWVPSVTDKDDLVHIISEQLKFPNLDGYASHILEFVEWYMHALGQKRTVVSLRDILSWVNFLNTMVAQGMDSRLAFVHGGCLVLLDGIGSNASSGSLLAGDLLRDFRRRCLNRLVNVGSSQEDMEMTDEKGVLGETTGEIESTESLFGVHPFHITKGQYKNQKIKFTLRAPTTSDNAMRVFRAMQVKKPILLEGSPGVGKTSLISALADATGHKLVRINLSEQTDLMDLFGSDLPVEGGNSGEFAWRDAPFLQAMKAGDWVLLDELNLASQSVLEGLNSCLDHRGAVYIPELDREFCCASEFRVFGAQNPLQQGGGRKGLPKSFVNRFTQVFVAQLTKDDLLFICSHLFPEIEGEMLRKMIQFNTRIYDETMIKCSFGRKGSPWEFNLRDVFRWLDLIQKDDGAGLGKIQDPAEYLDMIYLQRMRVEDDRRHIISIFEDIFGKKYNRSQHPSYHVSRSYLQVGHSILSRVSSDRSVDADAESEYHLLQTSLAPMQNLMKCVEMNWMAILTGPSASGKTSLVRLLAQLTGRRLKEFAMNSGVDTMELLGGFEQVDLARHRQLLMGSLRELTSSVSKELLLLLDTSRDSESTGSVLRALQQLNDGLYTLESQVRFTRNSLTGAIDKAAHASDQAKNYESARRLLEILRTNTITFNLTSFLADGTLSVASIEQALRGLLILENEPVIGRFEWIDGVLLNALEHGHWLLIDNANLCNPSVLDRLNPLFEPNGVLMVNERGLVNGEVKIIYPHTDFRIFMTVDPRNGELSRAMRNRGIEIALVESDWVHNQQDTLRMANFIGLRGSQLPVVLGNLHAHMQTTVKKITNKSLTSRDYLMLGGFIVERLQRGEDFAKAVRESFDQIYVEDRNSDYQMIQQSLSILDGLVSSDDSATLNAISPANSPLLLAGSLYQNESVTAMVFLQGAYLNYLLQGEGSRDIIQADNSVLVQNNSRATIAADFFFENLSMIDVQWRLRWLNYIAPWCSGRLGEGILSQLHFVISSVSKHPIVRELDDMRQQIAKFAHIPNGFIEALPIDITNNTNLTNVIEAKNDEASTLQFGDVWPQYRIAIQAYRLLVRLVKLEFHERSVYHDAERQRLGNLKIMQQSYCHQRGRLSDHQLAHPIVAFFYPLTVAIKTATLSWINNRGYATCTENVFDSFGELFDKYDTVWACLQTAVFELGEVLLCIKMMRKSARFLLNLQQADFNTVLQIFDQITAGFSMTTGKTMRLLWKHFHPTTLSSTELFDIENRLQEIGNEFNAYSDDRGDGPKPTDLVVTSNIEMKQTLIEGISTLYFLDNDDSEKARKLVQSIGTVPEHLRRQIAQHKLSQKSVQAGSTKSQWELALVPLIDYSSIVKEINIICGLYPLSAHECLVEEPDIERIKANICQLRDFSLTQSSRPPLDFTSHQRLVWIFEDLSNNERKPAALNGITQDILHRWHERLWRNSYHRQEVFDLDESRDMSSLPNISQGPSSLFESVETLTYLNLFRSINKMPVKAYDDALQQFKSLQKHLASEDVFENRYQIELLMVIFMLQQTIDAFEPLLKADVYKELRDAFRTLKPLVKYILDTSPDKKSKNIFETARAALETLARGLGELPIQQQLVTAIQLIVQSLAADGSHFLRTIGKARAYLGLAFVSGYIPDYPLDPMAKPRLKKRLLEEKKSSLTKEVFVRQSIEDIYTGNNTNILIMSRLQELARVNVDIRSSLANFSLRPEKSQLNDVFSDLRYLQKTMIERHVESLLLELENGGDGTILQRERLFQDNAVQFIHRMSSKYPMYRDILQPLLVAVQEIKYGLRLMSTGLVQQQNPDRAVLEAVLVSLLRTPDISAIATNESWRVISQQDNLNVIKKTIFSSSQVEKKWNVYLKYLIVALRRVSHSIDVSGHLQIDQMKTLEAFFDEIVEIWKAAEEYANKLAIENESLYKKRTKIHQGMTDEEMDEIDFKQTFANFNEEFADLEGEQLESSYLDPASTTRSPSVEKISVLDDENIQNVGVIHRFIFRSYNYAMTGRPSKSNTWQQSMWHSYNMASEIASMAGTTFSHTLDTQCRGAHLLSTSFTIARFDSGDKIDAQDTIYDFYRSENVSEAKRMYPIVNSLKIRTLELLDQWPEHAILQQLVTISDRLAGFSITSPIAKLLTGIELLLQKSEDWESYASRDVSIKSHREAIITLIVSWRQLELNCWPKLLAAQDVYHQNAAYKWWFHLYNTIIRSTLTSSSNNDDIHHRTKDLLGTLDQFLQSSPLSEFSTRLELIHTFYSHLRAQAHFKLSAHQQLNEDSRLMHESVADVLDNVHKYYSQFLASANVRLEQLRKPIEKDLKEFVKIASWKDVNIHALKQSAQRTHRQLHKCIRKYKEVLARSMTDIIAAYQQEVPIFQAADEKHYQDHNPAIVQKLASSSDSWISSLDVTVSQPIDHRAEEEKERFANLERTWTKLRKYCEEDLIHLHSSTMLMPLEEFMTDIITQIKTFQKETPPIMTEENKSLVKNQKSLKKKALVDFLKQLKRIGIKQRVHVIAQHNQDQGYIFRLPSVALASSLRDLSLQKPSLSCYNWANDELGPLWSKASDYYYRVLARISHLRTVISTNLLSKDMTSQEIEKGAGSTEYLLSLLISERNCLHKMENNLSLLYGVAVQLASIYESRKTMSPVHFDTVKAARLLAHKMHTDKIADSLAQAVSLFGIQTDNFSGKLRDNERLHKDLQICAETMRRMREEVDFLFTQRYLYPNVSYKAPIVITDDVVRTIESHHEILQDIQQRLATVMHVMPESRHIFGAIEAYISNIRTQDNSPNGIAAESSDTTTIIELRDKSNSVIDSILISVQELRELKKNDAAGETADAESEYGMRDGHIRAEHDRVLSLTHQLRLEIIAGRSVDLINQLAILMEHHNHHDHQSAILITSLLQRVYPFLQQHIFLAHHTLAEFLLHHKAMAKLTFVMCNTFTTIFTKGFCMPEGAAEDNSDGVEDGVQGTGIGEGEGSNDVSDQIEDEEQVLGTQNDKQPDPEKQDTKEEKKGMEMENDFDGQLEDVEDEVEKDNEGSEDESETEEMDEQVGDIDDMNPDAVDDKMWGDDSADNLDESDKKVDQDQSTGQQDQSDIVAKDNQEKSEKNGEKPQKNEQKVSEEQEDEQAPDDFTEEGEDGEDGDEDENEGSKPGEQLNVDIPEAETLELPDDMNLDMDGEEDGEEKGDDGDEFVDNMDVDGPEGDNEQEENDGGEPFKDKLDDSADEENAEGEPLKEEENDATVHDGAIEEEEKEKPKAGDEKQDQNITEGKENLNVPNEDEEDMAMEDDAQSREQPNNDASADNDFGVKGDVGKVSASSFGESEGNDKDAHDTAASKNVPQKEKEESGKSDRGNNPADKKSETDVKEQRDETEKQQEKTNPRRSLGDALKSWKRRLNDVADAEEDENEPEAHQDPESIDAKINENQSFEYLKNDDDSHDMQTMGSAAEDQLRNLNEFGAIDEEAPLDPSEHADMEVDEPVEETDQQLSAELTDASRINDKGAILSKRMAEKTDGMDENEMQAADASHFAHEPLEQEEIDRMREELELKVTEWRETGKDGAKARELWQIYENLTHDLAFGLCEQLRLILEPTLATKLKGDYRTGKRLNMKRIIPYIASQFKKDKIWLRRTKPSKRQYQVMIAVDDSKSMSESRSIQLAYETLALISKALSQLEVGDISIVSFGERVQLLHPFDQPFTDEGGASVLQQFTFAQQKTYVKSLIETSIGLLEHARSNHSGPQGTELWQLQLIISDGICEDHEAVRALVRRAAEHQIMVIFIIVDNKPEKDSILATTNVKYKNVGGKMTLQMERYLDSFPFEYYLILRDVNALPEVLSDALRQYFSFVAG